MRAVPTPTSSTPLTVVRVDLRTAGGDPVVGVMHWTPTRRLVADDHVLLPAAVSVPLTGSATTVALPPTDAAEYDPGAWCWRVDEYARGGEGVTRYVLLPTVQGSLALEYSGLVDIDPQSLDPVAAPPAVWQVQLDEVHRRVEQLAETGTVVDLSGYVTDAELDAALAGVGARAGGCLFDGMGAPDLVPGALPGDYYLDKASGQLYKLGG